MEHLSLVLPVILKNHKFISVRSCTQAAEPGIQGELSHW